MMIVLDNLHLAGPTARERLIEIGYESSACSIPMLSPYHFGCNARPLLLFGRHLPMGRRSKITGQ